MFEALCTCSRFAASFDSSVARWPFRVPARAVGKGRYLFSLSSSLPRPETVVHEMPLSRRAPTWLARHQLTMDKRKEGCSSYTRANLSAPYQPRGMRHARHATRRAKSARPRSRTHSRLRNGTAQ